MSNSDLIALISDRRIDTSGAFYGVGAPEVADNIFHAVASEYINEHWNGTPEDRPSAIRFNSQWAIEKDGRCQLGILRDPHGPEHVFGDITDFLPAIWRRRCGLDGSRGWTNERLEQSLPYAKLNLSAWCCKCHQNCRLTQTHMHRAGSPCVHHITLGDRQLGQGKHHFLFWAWVALMRMLRIKIIVHENMRGFGDVSLRALLGDIYVVIHILSDPVSLGWPIQRHRQFVVMILKVWVFEVLPDVPRTTQDIETVLDLRTTISNVFTRDIARGFTWEAFLNADATDIMAERAWARQRPGVRARWFGCPEDSSTTSPDVYRDTRDCFLGHLTKEERRCYDMSQERWPLCGCNVSQNPAKA